MKEYAVTITAPTVFLLEELVELFDGTAHSVKRDADGCWWIRKGRRRIAQIVYPISVNPITVCIAPLSLDIASLIRLKLTGRVDITPADLTRLGSLVDNIKPGNEGGSY